MAGLKARHSHTLGYKKCGNFIVIAYFLQIKGIKKRALLINISPVSANLLILWLA